jgi:HAD superfamily hydrolase (TIGR01509 family)
VKLRAVLFDWDGTLVHSMDAVLASYHDASEQVLGRAFPGSPEEIEKILPMRIEESMRSVATNEQELKQLLSLYAEAYERNSVSLGRAFSGSVDTLRELREKDFAIGVVTSKALARVRSDEILYGLSDLIDFFVTAESTAERKPAPEPILFAVNQLGVLVEDTLFVGDGPQDVIAGHAAGVKVVGAAYGSHGLAALESVSPEWIISDISELMSVISAFEDGLLEIDGGL